MSQTMSDALGVIPHRDVNTPFSIWYKIYYLHIYNLFNIFKRHLQFMEPFNTNGKFDNDNLIPFAKHIYIKSSGAI